MPKEMMKRLRKEPPNQALNLSAADVIEALLAERVTDRELRDRMGEAINVALMGDPNAKRLPKSVSAMRPVRAEWMRKVEAEAEAEERGQS